MKLTKRQDALINSGITLTKREAEEVERFLWSQQTTVTPYQLNSMIGRAAIGLPPNLPR